jgi:tetratricopeptide (TPR) repeat protein
MKKATAMQIGAVVGIVTLLVYSGALSCGFINLDDPFYITNNPLIKSLTPGAILKVFSESHLAAWLPLTYLSFAVDYHFWGDNPVGYHLTNILLHGANALLVVLLADGIFRAVREGDWLVEGVAWGYPVSLLLAGLLFALHPLRVESVAWAAERKDVLNGFFTLASLLAYLGYVRRTEEGGNSLGCRGAYLLSLVLFALSLLAKQVSVTLPAILLVLDWYPLRRLRRGSLVPPLVEKIPFFAVSLLITVATLYFAVAEKKLISMASMPFFVRLVVSGNALFEYLRLSLFPVGISPYFVLPKPLPYGYPVKMVVVVAIGLLLFRYGGRLRGTATAGLCYLIAMAPMLAFIQAGDDIALAARYTYLPLIAPTIGVVLLLQRYGSRPGGGKATVAASLSLLVLLGMTGMTLKLIPVWRDTGSFWSRVIEISPVGRAYGDRGVYYLITGRSDAAREDFTAAIDIATKSGVRTLYNLYAFRGVALSDTGRFAEAVADFDRAIGLYPHPTYFQLRGTALRALGRSAEAEKDLRSAGPNPPPIDWFEKE